MWGTSDDCKKWPTGQEEIYQTYVISMKFMEQCLQLIWRDPQTGIIFSMTQIFDNAIAYMSYLLCTEGSDTYSWQLRMLVKSIISDKYTYDTLDILKHSVICDNTRITTNSAKLAIYVN